MKDLLVLDLGLRSYAEALSFQRALATARIAKRVPHDVLLLVEHPPVITLGRSTKAGNLLASEALEILNSSQITALIVTEGKKPVGIVHLHDILRAGVA